MNAWYTVTGTHDGEFVRIPPTGHEVDFPFSARSPSMMY